MTDKIVIKTEYWEDDKLLKQSAGAFDSTDKTLVQVCKLASDTFQNNMSNIITEYLTK